MYIADPICSFIISLMILVSVVPLLTMTASNLMMKMPEKFKNKRRKIISKVIVSFKIKKSFRL